MKDLLHGLFGPSRKNEQEDSINWKAWSHGQMVSKQALCERIEEVFSQKEPLRLWVLAGWYGLLPFLLTVRGKVHLESVHLFDQDPGAIEIARRVNNLLETEGRFSASIRDVNKLAIEPSTDGGPHLVVNTSCEHLKTHRWWQSLPRGTWVAVQGTDMPHPEHVRLYESVDDLRGDFPGIGSIRTAEEKTIISGNKTFRRFTLIGRKDVTR